MLALADENPNGKISWKDFIPIGIKAIQIFLERNKRLAKQPEAMKEINKETLKFVYEHEIKKTNTILIRRFQSFDYDKEKKTHKGVITFAQM